MKKTKRYIKRAGVFFERNTEKLAARADENETLMSLLIAVEVITAFVPVAALFACLAVGLSTPPTEEPPFTDFLLILLFMFIALVSGGVSGFIGHRLRW